MHTDRIRAVHVWALAALLAAATPGVSLAQDSQAMRPPVWDDFTVAPESISRAVGESFVIAMREEASCAEPPCSERLNTDVALFVADPDVVSGPTEVELNAEQSRSRHWAEFAADVRANAGEEGVRTARHLMTSRGPDAPPLPLQDDTTVLSLEIPGERPLAQTMRFTCREAGATQILARFVSIFLDADTPGDAPAGYRPAVFERLIQVECTREGDTGVPQGGDASSSGE